jgi:hypothetical protein
VTYKIRASSSTLTSLSWFARYPNAQDNYSGVTAISNGTITINSTPTDYTFQITLPSGVSNGLEVYFSFGAFTSGTLDITGVQLEAGSVATPFERRDYGRELIMCQRYYYQFDSVSNGYVATGAYRAGTSTAEASFNHPVTMRAAPTLSANAAAFNVYSTTGAPLSTSVTVIHTAPRWGWVSSGVGLVVATQGTGALFYMASGQVMSVSAEL